MYVKIRGSPVGRVGRPDFAISAISTTATEPTRGLARS